MSKKLTREEIEKKVDEIIIDKLGIDESELKPEAVLSTDFMADSLDAVDICIALEMEFGIEIEDECFETVHTLKMSDLYDLVGEKL